MCQVLPNCLCSYSLTAPGEAPEMCTPPGAGGGGQNWRVKTEDFVVMCMAKMADQPLQINQELL